MSRNHATVCSATFRSEEFCHLVFGAELGRISRARITHLRLGLSHFGPLCQGLSYCLGRLIFQATSLEFGWVEVSCTASTESGAVHLMHPYLPRGGSDSTHSRPVCMITQQWRSRKLSSTKQLPSPLVYLHSVFHVFLNLDFVSMPAPSSCSQGRIHEGVMNKAVAQQCSRVE